MKKSTRIVKRLIALSLVLLLSIESFAAVVGDNDGAAFITKAEFDSMKNDFQSQLDRYNSSIDNKIEGSIAAYLAGIRLAKTSKVNFINNQNKYSSASNLPFQRGLIGIVFNGTQYVYGGSSQSYSNGGLNGWYRASIPHSNASGLLLDTRLSSGGESGLFLGVGTASHDITTDVTSGHSTSQNDANALNSRTLRWQLFWYNETVSTGTAYPTGNSYYDYKCLEDNAMNLSWRPILFGLQQGAANIVGSRSRSTLRSSLHNFDIIDQHLCLINDEILSNCVDAFSINGIELDKVDPRVGELDVKMYLVANQPTEYFNTANQKNVFYRAIIDYGWFSGGGEGDYTGAYKTITAFNTIPQSGSTYTYFDGYNHLLYLSHINNPTDIYTGSYSSTKFDNWLHTQPSSLYLDYNNNLYWNMRYGTLLLNEDDSDAHYDLTVKNDSTGAIGMKIIKNPDAIAFDSVVGLKTDKSDETQNNNISISAGETIKIGFDVTDNDPVFFKCSDGASITLVELIKSSE